MNRHQERLLEPLMGSETRMKPFTVFESIYAPWLTNEFVKSHFIEDTRKWEHIPMDEVIIYKGSSCGASEVLANDWQEMWDRVKRDQEGLNKYMEDLKSKYPDWKKL